jgi:hypothetical protein
MPSREPPTSADRSRPREPAPIADGSRPPDRPPPADRSRPREPAPIADGSRPRDRPPPADRSRPREPAPIADRGRLREPPPIADRSRLAGVWANDVDVVRGRHEVTLDFFRQDVRRSAWRVLVARVAVSPSLAEQLRDLLDSGADDDRPSRAGGP